MNTVAAIMKSIRLDLIGQAPSLELFFKYFVPQQLHEVNEQLSSIFPLNLQVSTLYLQFLNIFYEICNDSGKMDAKLMQSCFPLKFFLDLIPQQMNAAKDQLAECVIDCMFSLNYEGQFLQEHRSKLSSIGSGEHLSLVVLFYYFIQRTIQISCTTADLKHDVR
jgi:hypothetical protein